MEQPDKALEQITQHARKLRKHLPEMGVHYDALNAGIYRDGALCPAVTQGCTGCMLFQAQQALDLGADREQIFETLAVAVGLGGSMASSKSAQVMAFLEQKGLV